MKLSVVIPAHNEATVLADTVSKLVAKLVEESIDHEVLVINDNSTDNTEKVLEALHSSYPTLRTWIGNSNRRFLNPVRGHNRR